jgi:hypothetical protein
MREFGGFLSFPGVKKVCNLFIAVPDGLGLGFVLFCFDFFQFFLLFFVFPLPRLELLSFRREFSFA